MPRVDLQTLSPQQRQTLAELMLNYINDEVVGRHGPDWHHTNSEAFFLNHRDYIQGMEAFLTANGGGQFVPLPKWDPATPIPQEFRAVKSRDDDSPRPALVNTNPNRRVPSNLLKPAICSVNADTFASQVEEWHDDVHDTIGGAMDSFGNAPAAVIFWCWHAFVDDMYEDWRNCPEDASADPVAYVTNFPTQGPVARVVYPAVDQHVHELFFRAGSPWSFADLTYLGGGGRPTGQPSAYLTDFPGQGPVARVVYRRTNNHIIELFAIGSTLAWGSEDLSALTGAPDASGDPVGYVTNFPNQGPVARVVYPGVDQHVHELYLFPGSSWAHADLTDRSGGGRPAGQPSAYLTEFPGQGPVARVVYRRSNNHIIELYAFASTLAWDSEDLSALSGAPDAAGDPVGYVTNLPGQGPVARVVYRATNGHIIELFHFGPGSSWASADLIPFA